MKQSQLPHPAGNHSPHPKTTLAGEFGYHLQGIHPQLIFSSPAAPKFVGVCSEGVPIDFSIHAR
jgi:hypothetical protein